MQANVGIFAADLLIVTDLMAKLEQEMPLAKVTVYATEELAGSLPEGSDSLVKTGFTGMEQEDVMILLSDPGDDDRKWFTKFDGSIIDLTGTMQAHYEDVTDVEHPVVSAVRGLFADGRPLRGIVSLPAAAFGKFGVEDLLEQTRSIYSFQPAEPKLFDTRIAFNVLFGAESEGGGVTAKLKEQLAAAGITADMRVLPISTAFIVDLFDTGDVTVPEQYQPMEDEADVAWICESDRIAVRSTAGGVVTLTGDYVRIMVKNIMQTLKDVLGA